MDKEKLNDIVCESSSDYDVLNNAYNYIENLEQQCKKQKKVIDEAIKYIEKCLEQTPTENREKTDDILDMEYKYILDILKKEK